jgi:hypothetical protein
MKAYCQFLALSTGYVSGSIPPRFEDSNKKPIDMLGSDGVFILDARNNIETMKNDCIKRAAKMINKPVGFKIVRASSFLNNGRVIFTKIF